MRVFMTGATGFIGGHILDAVLGAGHEATCLARGAGRARLEARPAAREGRLRTVQGEFTRPESWVASVAGHDGVVNAVGVIREGRGAGSSFEAIHRDAPVALFTAAARAGARKIVQVSACGADDGAATRYHLTKRAADGALAALGVPWVVLRPSIVYGPGDHSMAYFARLAALPVVPVPGDGAALLEPVHVSDVARAALLSLEREGLSGFAADLGGGEPLRFDALVDRIAAALGLAVPRRKAYIPWPLMSLAARAGDLLGGRGPITGEELSMLRRGNVARGGETPPRTPPAEGSARGRAFEERFGFAPTPLDVGLVQRFAARGTLFAGGAAPDRGSPPPEE